MWIVKCIIELLMRLCDFPLYLRWVGRFILHSNSSILNMILHIIKWYCWLWSKDFWFLFQQEESVIFYHFAPKSASKISVSIMAKSGFLISLCLTTICVWTINRWVRLLPFGNHYKFNTLDSLSKPCIVRKESTNTMPLPFGFLAYMFFIIIIIIIIMQQTHLKYNLNQWFILNLSIWVAPFAVILIIIIYFFRSLSVAALIKCIFVEIYSSLKICGVTVNNWLVVLYDLGLFFCFHLIFVLHLSWICLSAGSGDRLHAHYKISSFIAMILLICLILCFKEAGL